jgi:hypothetical protein
MGDSLGMGLPGWPPSHPDKHSGSRGRGCLDDRFAVDPGRVCYIWWESAPYSTVAWGVTEDPLVAQSCFLEVMIN